MTITHGDKKTRTRGNKYNLTPETARVGVQIGKVTSGVLHPFPATTSNVGRRCRTSALERPPRLGGSARPDSPARPIRQAPAQNVCFKKN